MLLFVYGSLREGFFVGGSHHDETPELYKYYDLGCEHEKCVEVSNNTYQYRLQRLGNQLNLLGGFRLLDQFNKALSW